ncbi:Kinesin-2 [Galdieria sulphuraria]|nr:Kinesin-2 [Galdieria sulphuraria]
MFVDNVTSDASRLSISSASSVSSITSCNNTTLEPQYRIFSSNSVEVVAPQKYSETNKSAKQHLSKWNFSFDRIFGPESTQEDIFEEISQLVQSALDGYRVCIFAYGQTGSGKTYTMLGGENEGESGIIPKSMRKIFSAAEYLHEQNWEFHLKASFLEIYNETIRDLLADHTISKERNYDIKIDRLTGATYVVGLTVEDISTPYQLEKLLKKSVANRSTAATRCNERSSRSHSVFRLYISGRNNETGEERMGLLNLIDLAGSERLNSSGSTGDRLRETQHINKSLSALGDVISSLSNKEKHIPYRNSKLTYLLQDSLGGDSKTLMFVNVSPTCESFQETLCSLRFAQKVNSCQIGTAHRVTKVDLCAGFFAKECTM